MLLFSVFFRKYLKVHVYIGTKNKAETFFICLPVVILTTFFVSAFSQDDLQTRQVSVESLLSQPFKKWWQKDRVHHRYCLPWFGFKMPG